MGRYEGEDRGTGVWVGYWRISPASWYRKNLSPAIGKKYISTLLTRAAEYEIMAASLRYKTIRSLIVDYRLRAAAPRSQCELNRQIVINGYGSIGDAQNGNGNIFRLQRGINSKPRGNNWQSLSIVENRKETQKRGYYTLTKKE